MMNKTYDKCCSIDVHQKLIVARFRNWNRFIYALLWSTLPNTSAIEKTFNAFVRNIFAENHYNVAIIHAAKKLVQIIYVMENLEELT